MTDHQWANWQRRLAGEKVPIHDAEIDSGYYRIKRKNKSTGKSHYVAAAFWRDSDDVVHGVIDGAAVNANGAADAWLWAVKNPITEAEFRKVEAGGDWSDLHIDEPAQNDRTPGIGDNSAAVDDAELIREQIESAKAGVGDYVKIASNEQTTRAQTLRARLQELAASAKKIHKKLKDPHWDKCKELDATWLTMVKEAAAAALQIREAMNAWENVKLKATQEAQRKIDDANRAAAEAAAKANKPAPAPIAPPAAPVAPAKIKGAIGRAAHVGTVKVVTAIADQDVLYAYFKSYDDVKSLLLGLAQKAVKNGHTVPGVTIEEQADVR